MAHGYNVLGLSV